MDSKYLQQQRFQLQKRFRRMNSCHHLVFHSAMIQLWNYLHEQPLLQGVLHRLKVESPAFADEIAALPNGTMQVFDTEKESLYFVFRVLEHCWSVGLDGSREPEQRMVQAFASANETLDTFRELYLDPFYEYLDEALDNQAAVLSLLLKYKRKVEWFEREELVARAKSDERELAKHLYAYLFDQGLDFHIEPQSASGEVDLVSSDLVLDAKVFDGAGRDSTYVRQGINQLHTYTQDFNQTVGYLAIYKTCPEALHFDVPSADDLVPHIVAAGKTLYLLTIDICEHTGSASKRGVFKKFTIDEASLVRAATVHATPATSVGTTNESPGTAEAVPASQHETRVEPT